MSTKKKSSPDSIVRQIKRKTRRKYSAEEKIRIVLEGLRGEESITDLCRREGIRKILQHLLKIGRSPPGLGVPV